MPAPAPVAETGAAGAANGFGGPAGCTARPLSTATKAAVISARQSIETLQCGQMRSGRSVFAWITCRRSGSGIALASWFSFFLCLASLLSLAFTALKVRFAWSRAATSSAFFARISAGTSCLELRLATAFAFGDMLDSEAGAQNTETLQL